MIFTFTKQKNPRMLIEVDLHGYYGDADMYDSITLEYKVEEGKLEDLLQQIFESCNALLSTNHREYNHNTIPHWEELNWEEVLPRQYEYFDENGEKFIVMEG